MIDNTPMKTEISFRHAEMFSCLDVMGWKFLKVGMVRVLLCGLVLVGEYFLICVTKKRNLRRNDTL